MIHERIRTQIRMPRFNNQFTRFLPAQSSYKVDNVVNKGLHGKEQNKFSEKVALNRD